MLAPHQHFAVIKAWAEGHTIQFRYPEAEWTTYTGGFEDGSFPAFNTSRLDWRIKPNTLRFRCFLWRHPTASSAELNVRCVNELENAEDPREQWASFVRWIDTEWREVELP